MRRGCVCMSRGAKQRDETRSVCIPRWLHGFTCCAATICARVCVRAHTCAYAHAQTRTHEYTHVDTLIHALARNCAVMECVICFGEGIDALLLPCQHSGLCSVCAEAVLRRNPALCPICRMCVSEVIRFEQSAASPAPLASAAAAAAAAAAAGSGHVDVRATAAAGRAVADGKPKASAQELAPTAVRAAACDASHATGGWAGNSTSAGDGAHGASSAAASGAAPAGLVRGVESDDGGDVAVAGRVGIVHGVADDKRGGGDGCQAAEEHADLAGVLMGAGSVGLSDVTVDAAGEAEEAEEAGAAEEVDGGAGPVASAAEPGARATAGQGLSAAHADAAASTQAVTQDASAGGSDKVVGNSAKGVGAAGKTSRAGGSSGGTAAGGGGGKGNKKGGKGRGKGGGKGSGRG